jgi:hypothetical protein
MEQKVRHSGAVSQAKTGMLESDAETRLEALDKTDKVDKLLADLKARKGL